MKIAKVAGREIFDSRGIPTIECELGLDDGITVVASVPSGTSCGQYEALELRDGVASRLGGKGVLKAIEKLENDIAPHLIGQEPNGIELDLLLVELDGTRDKSNLGANALLAASAAVFKAQAAVEELQLFELIAHVYGVESVALPFPMFNVINGGAHADNNLLIQECMIMPLGAQNFRDSMEVALTVFHHIKALLKKKNKRLIYGEEGGLAPDLENETEALDIIAEAIELAGFGNGKCAIALDIAASEFYDPKTKVYNWHGQEYSSDDMIALYTKLVDNYPLYSIEDGLADDDWMGWQVLTKQLGERLQIVGDDIFATNPYRIVQGLELGAATAAVIKPNQIGTITETLQAIQLCQEHGLNTIVSHRSGDTCDTLIADLAVGTSAGQIKAGGCTRGERMAKYNRLLAIEDYLAFTLLSV